MHRGQIDYRNLQNMIDGSARAAARRGTHADHQFVIGCFTLFEGRVTLFAVYGGAAFDVREETTSNPIRFARWRTKQAAWKWLQDRPCLADLRVIHLGRLDVLPDPPSVIVQT
jgi:hypothetical protein